MRILPLVTALWQSKADSTRADGRLRVHEGTQVSSRTAPLDRPPADAGRGDANPTFLVVLLRALSAPGA